MKVKIKPSDLYYKYRRKKVTRHLPKFSGKPDGEYFGRDDLYEVISMFESVHGELGSTDQAILQRAEELLDRLPALIDSREMIFDALVDGLRDYV
ncbi:MAG: hypothetical protein D6818_04655 [Bacteroidetes bacterium]|nr:MAG: hypothetical protein D6818_04655 [Bacteroidota bacterium]